MVLASWPAAADLRSYHTFARHSQFTSTSLEALARQAEAVAAARDTREAPVREAARAKAAAEAERAAATKARSTNKAAFKP